MCRCVASALGRDWRGEQGATEDGRSWGDRASGEDAGPSGGLEDGLGFPLGTSSSRRPRRGWLIDCCQTNIGRQTVSARLAWRLGLVTAAGPAIRAVRPLPRSPRHVCGPHTGLLPLLACASGAAEARCLARRASMLIVRPFERTQQCRERTDSTRTGQSMRT